MVTAAASYKEQWVFWEGRIMNQHITMRDTQRDYLGPGDACV